MTHDMEANGRGVQMRREPTLAFVIPCFNEEAALHVTADVLKKKMIQLEDSQAVARDSFVIFVDDGSRDKTWDVIASLHEKDPSLFRGVKLAHNRGHQNALFAGLMQALSMNVDAVVSMDADLQDDPNAVMAWFRNIVRELKSYTVCVIIAILILHSSAERPMPSTL